MSGATSDTARPHGMLHWAVSPCHTPGPSRPMSGAGTFTRWCRANPIWGITIIPRALFAPPCPECPHLQQRPRATPGNPQGPQHGVAIGRADHWCGGQGEFGVATRRTTQSLTGNQPVDATDVDLPPRRSTAIPDSVLPSTNRGNA